MRIDYVDLDEGNTPHVTRHGVTEFEVYAAFDTKPSVRRNKGDGTAGYYIVANGIRVNFVYDAEGRAARPISAWRMR
ncbi:hypothetical protein EF847_14710 [Actinobacteria bacterium YIM 96077]|uniref:DUF4258 domain-containing protein n=1 Tax=Phytoactinopolyspora halophila TaxID=1981511 RepID=A0A329QTE0_9ACTN|nr:hypothetical protein [Phytoactinopolyspora halophila]AYY13757.1 hypothetical protein EF847_14710 [Actinobacteria bacterium YIM 96077]RAW15700.1 hypothetical protein DPM12_08630 [Phytoactinopolyspora halophila]